MREIEHVSEDLEGVEDDESEEVSESVSENKLIGQKISFWLGEGDINRVNKYIKEKFYLDEDLDPGVVRVVLFKLLSDAGY